MSSKSAAKPSQTPPRPAPKTARAPKRPPLCRSEGQRLFREVQGSLAGLAERLNTTKPSVANWKAGDFTPNVRQRARIEQVYGIPATAWDRLPADQLPPSEPDDDSEAELEDDDDSKDDSNPSAFDPIKDLNDLIRTIKRHLARKDLQTRERMQQQDMLSKLVVRKVKLVQQREMLEDRIIREHPAWQRFKNIVITALARYPEAQRDVEAAMNKALEEERASNGA